jgi:hypothetical protein
VQNPPAIDESNQHDDTMPLSLLLIAIARRIEGTSRSI